MGNEGNMKIIARETEGNIIYEGNANKKGMGQTRLCEGYPDYP